MIEKIHLFYLNPERKLISNLLNFFFENLLKVYCLDHRSYMKHDCPKGNRGDVTVVICPLCAKGVRLNPDEDPNITWEKHASGCLWQGYVSELTQKSDFLLLSENKVFFISI